MRGVRHKLKAHSPLEEAGASVRPGHQGVWLINLENVDKVSSAAKAEES